MHSQSHLKFRPIVGNVPNLCVYITESGHLLRTHLVHIRCACDTLYEPKALVPSQSDGRPCFCLFSGFCVSSSGCSSSAAGTASFAREQCMHVHHMCVFMFASETPIASGHCDAVNRHDLALRRRLSLKRSTLSSSQPVMRQHQRTSMAPQLMFVDIAGV